MGSALFFYSNHPQVQSVEPVKILGEENAKIDEKNSFTINLVRVMNAQQGETNKTLSARTKNILNDELTGVINSRDPDDKLDEGENIKVVIQYPYKIDK